VRKQVLCTGTILERFLLRNFKNPLFFTNYPVSDSFFLILFKTTVATECYAYI